MEQTENIVARIIARANESTVAPFHIFILFFTPLASSANARLSLSLWLTYLVSRTACVVVIIIVAVCKHASLHFSLSWADINLLIHI